MATELFSNWKQLTYTGHDNRVNTMLLGHIFIELYKIKHNVVACNSGLWEGVDINTERTYSSRAPKGDIQYCLIMISVRLQGGNFITKEF